MQMQTRMRKCANCGERYPSNESRCPVCSVHGSKPEKGAAAVRYALGYPQCDWESEGLRCRYPGAISSATNGEGSRYCRLHYGCDSASYGEQVVQASQDYEHMTSAEKLEEANAAAREFCGGKVIRKVPQVRAARPGVEWARNIVARIEAGESLPPIFEKFAREALGGR